MLVVGMLCNEDSETKVNKSELCGFLWKNEDSCRKGRFSPRLTLTIVLSWSSPWIKMTTMMRLLISCPFLMMYIYHDALPHGNDKVQNQVGFVPPRQLSPPIVWEPFHAKIISNDHAAPVALTNIYCWVQPTTARNCAIDLYNSERRFIGMQYTISINNNARIIG